MKVKDRIIVALDVDTLKEAESLVSELAEFVGFFKVGLQLLTSVGTPKAVEAIHNLGGRVFLDGKFCDIPNTVGKAATKAAALGVSMFNVHASAGLKAMISAVDNKGSSKVLVVTVLTFLGENETFTIFGESPKNKVVQFAQQAWLAGADGIICSPQELNFIGNNFELAGLLKVVPGVRPKWATLNDQKRSITPEEAIRAGADLLVIGRPITKPPFELTSISAAKAIIEEIEKSLEGRR